MESYWDLYVAYVNKCVADNWANDIDPAHYEMEWNHFLPQCIFGDQPVGHYLLLRQHAIASALQTLAFKRNCLCGWHKRLLPPALLELSWPFYCSSKTGDKNPMRRNPHLLLGERNGMFGRTHTEEVKQKLRKSIEGTRRRAKPIVLIHPGGTEELFDAAIDACQKYGLSKSKLSGVVNGVLCHTKGFKAKRP